MIKIADGWAGNDGVNMGKLKCIPGLPRVGIKGMHNLIEGVFDMRAQADGNGYAMKYWRGEWEGMGG